MAELRNVNWREFLASWQDEIFSLIPLLSSSVSDDKKRAMLATPLLRAGADQLDIASAETRLGMELPHELKDFYRASNGWLQVGFDAWDLRILGVHELLGKAANIDASYYADVAEYFSSDEPEHSVFKRQNLRKIILLSDQCQDGCYFAVPEKLSWEYGVIRFHSDQVGFRSFSALMQYERQMCTYLLRGTI